MSLNADTVRGFIDRNTPGRVTYALPQLGTTEIILIDGWIILGFCNIRVCLMIFKVSMLSQIACSDLNPKRLPMSVCGRYN